MKKYRNYMAPMLLGLSLMMSSIGNAGENYQYQYYHGQSSSNTQQTHYPAGMREQFPTTQERIANPPPRNFGMQERF